MTTGVELFPQTLPAGTVVGNPRSQAGPAAAIPFAKFAEEIAGDFEASAITFTAAGTGAFPRTVQSKERDIVSVTDFYANGGSTGPAVDKTGVTESHLGFIAAVTAALGMALYMPGGTYLLSAEVPVPNSIGIYGAGREITKIQMSSTTQNGFNVASDGAVHMRDFQIIGSVSQTAGACIKVNGATNGVTTNQHSSFLNLGFLVFWRGIEFVSAAQWRVAGCQFFGDIDAGIIARDIVSADSGDSFITENMFSGASSSSTIDHIRHLSGGGLHVVNNSFLGGGTSYRMAWESTTGSSQIRLQGNTVDASQQIAGFLFDRTAAGTIFGISIKDNFFDTAVAAAPSIWFKTNAVFPAQISISGNDHLVTSGNVGIQIDGGVDYSITGELFVGNANGTGIATGNATATSIYLGSNSFENILTPYSINTSTQIRGGQFFGNSAIDFGNVADGAVSISGTITVAGLAVGDICTCAASQLIVGGVLLQAVCTAANGAKVTAFNKSGVAWNVGAGNVQVFGYRKEV